MDTNVVLEISSMAHQWTIYKKTSVETYNILKDAEESHLSLHSSVKEIDSSWKKVHMGLLEKLQLSLIQHKEWALTLLTSISTNSNINVQSNPNLCEFGKFLNSDKSKTIETQWDFYKNNINIIKSDHEKLHFYLEKINNTSLKDDKISIYQNELLPILNELTINFNKIINEEKKLDNIQIKSKEHFKNTTSKYLDTVLTYLIKLQNS